MAEKQTIMGRIAQLAKANINALLDKAEDPEKMIDQLIRDYTNSIVEAENAIAQTLGTPNKVSMKRLLGDQLIAREKTAKAQAQVTDALSSINILDPTSELGRFEDRVRRQEALAQGKIELAASSLDAQFAELETDSSQIEIEARLAALKGNNNQA